MRIFQLFFSVILCVFANGGQNDTSIKEKKSLPMKLTGLDSTMKHRFKLTVPEATEKARKGRTEKSGKKSKKISRKKFRNKGSPKSGSHGINL